MSEIVLVRHGESVYNKLGKFTGWSDCDLTLGGIDQAVRAGRVLKERGYSFDVAYSSALRRAVRTLDYVLDEMQLKNIPVRNSWMLNERCFGALEGLSKSEAVVKFGEKAIRQCRQDYYYRPPSVRDSKPQEEIVPKSESMHDATMRALSCWQKRIIPDVADGKRVLVVAHGDILRLLTGYLKGLGEEEIAEMPPFPNAVPIVFELNDDFSLANHYLLTETAETMPVATHLR